LDTARSVRAFRCSGPAHASIATCREEQLATGFTDNYVQLSIGIERIDDILADLGGLRRASDAVG
jgi:O-acetylhomoserine/O-acetylserine sulfhydrylase-like pyridoxal-dependent enzyme